jgi:hypothetical protein
MITFTRDDADTVLRMHSRQLGVIIITTVNS